MSTSERFTQVYNRSKEIFFDNSSKLIFFSDCHRGDNSWADDAVYNRDLFLHALDYYYDRNYTYIEVGDGDELWKNRSFPVILQSHDAVFRQIKKFHDAGRLYMLYGNHDIVKKNEKFVQKNLYQYYNYTTQRFEPLFDNIKIHEGLILRYMNSPVTIFVIHGHQGDLMNDRLWPIARFMVRYLWRPLELLGIRDFTSPAKNDYRSDPIERNIMNWAKSNQRMVIAGHTHRPVFPEPGAAPYFNTGSCVQKGFLTGIEIQNGQIAMVKWSIKAGKNRALYIAREIIAGPEKLEAF